MSRPDLTRAALLGLALLGWSPTSDASPAIPAPATCSVDSLVAEVRAGLVNGSPAYRRYLARLFREAAADLPESTLAAAFARESDPAMIEVLGAAMAGRSDRIDDPTTLRSVAERARADANPRVRAAAVRALGETSALEQVPEVYRQLARDPAREVREAVAHNLVVDNREVYSGHHAPVADLAVGIAVASRDPAMTATILGDLSLEAASPAATDSILPLLDSDEVAVRAAAVLALGGAAAASAAEVRIALLEHFPGEPQRAVRVAILQSIARLGFAGAIPDLRRLRAIDSSLGHEVDVWIRALGLGLQEWSLILREKQRL